MRPIVRTLAGSVEIEIAEAISIPSRAPPITQSAQLADILAATVAAKPDQG
jgi:hypothetical protein